MITMNKVTIWYTADSSGVLGRLDFDAEHVRSLPLREGWLEVQLLDENWKTTRVEQFRAAYRVSVVPDTEPSDERTPPQ